MTKRRVFNGVVYTLWDWRITKPAAAAVAKDLRKAGFLARVTKGRPIDKPSSKAIHHFIWYRNK